MNGISYLVAVQTPTQAMDTLDTIKNTGIVFQGGTEPALLGNIATLGRRTSPEVVNHY